MPLARFQFTAVDEAGNIVPGAEVEVRREVPGAPKAVLWADREGTVSKTNAFNADANGFAFFHVTGGAYRIKVRKGSELIADWRYVGIGTAGESDLPPGGYSSRVHSDAGAATFGTADVVLIVLKDTGEATDVNIPSAALRNGVPVIIKDGKGDANINPITPVFDGSEVCDGLAGSNFQITTPYGWVRFDPLPDGSGYFQLGGQL